MNSFKIRELTCPVCDRVCNNPSEAQECAKRGPPRRVPVWKQGERLRMKPEVFALRFADRPAEDNSFALTGQLFNGLRKRTANCAVKYDPASAGHCYEICVRWLGDESDTKVARKVWVRADDLEAQEAA